MLHDGTSSARDAGTLILLCGGASGEHDVSLASARSVLAAVNGTLRVRPIVIGRDGKMLGQRASLALLGVDPPADEARAEELVPAQAGELSRLTVREGDVVFPLLHGPFGEDGSVQGLLRLMGVPHVGSGVLASAVGMDKLMMKAVFKAHGLPQVRYRGLSLEAYRRDPDTALGTLKQLGLPVFVKPANLGSSLGIHLVEDAGALRDAVEDAFGFDRRVIVEAAVVGWRELEVAVLGNDAPELSPVGEVRYRAAFYDYASKYEPGGADLLIPAPVPAAIAERASTLARRAFEAIDGAGLARVDLFYDERSERVLVNEINTMPGFTATSMYPRLWAAAGLEFGALVERLVELARERA